MADVPLPEPLIQFRARFATVIGYTADQMHAHAAAVSAAKDAEIAGLREDAARYRWLKTRAASDWEYIGWQDDVDSVIDDAMHKREASYTKKA